MKTMQTNVICNVYNSDTVKDCCRVCMNTNNTMISVFSCDKRNIVHKLQYCTGVHIVKEDNFPTKICKLCLRQLTIAFNFKRKCLQSQDAFRIIKKEIKIEPVDDEISERNDEILERNDEVLEKNDEISQRNDEVLEKSDEILKRNSKCSQTNDRIPERNDESDDMCSANDDDLFVSKLKMRLTQTKLKKIKLRKGSKKQSQDINLNKPHKNPPLQCLKCNLKFGDKYESMDHRRSVHNNDIWICEICGKQFNNRGSHHSHLMAHQPARFKCDYCDYTSPHRADVVKHTRVHTGEKVFQCEFCTASFKCNSNLHSHKQRNHGGVKTHHCPRCTKSFYTKDKLRRHLDSHDNIKRHECQVCHSHFTRRCHWKRHLQKQHNVVIAPMRPGRKRKYLKEEINTGNT